MGAPTNQSANSLAICNPERLKPVFAELRGTIYVDANDHSKGVSSRTYWVSPVRDDVVADDARFLHVGDVIQTPEGDYKLTAVDSAGIIGEIVTGTPCSLYRVRRKVNGDIQGTAKITTYEAGSAWLTEAENTALKGG